MSRLGEGAFGQVVRATTSDLPTRPGLATTVAVKLLKRALQCSRAVDYNEVETSSGCKYNGRDLLLPPCAAAGAELEDFWQLCQELEVMKAVCTGAQHHPNVLALHGAVSNLDASTFTSRVTQPALLLHVVHSSGFTLAVHLLLHEYDDCSCPPFAQHVHHYCVNHLIHTLHSFTLVRECSVPIR